MDKVLHRFELGPLGSLLASPDQGTGSSGGGQILKESPNKSAGPDPREMVPTAKAFHYVLLRLLRFY